jgi:hypothetical protein
MEELIPEKEKNLPQKWKKYLEEEFVTKIPQKQFLIQNFS